MQPGVVVHLYTQAPATWACLANQHAAERAFRAEYVTEGKIAIDEDRSTPVFSPYTGRLPKLLVRPGDSVTKGQPLFVIEGAARRQAQNDYCTGITGLNKAPTATDRAHM